MKIHNKRKLKYIIVLILLISMVGIIYIFLNELYIEKKIKSNQYNNAIYGTDGEENINNSELSTQYSSDNNEIDVSEDKEEPVRELKYMKQLKEYNVIAELKIPKIDLTIDVLESYSEDSLKVSVTKFYGPNPNEIGNFCIAGHNYKNKTMFGKLNNLSKNDYIILTDGHNRTVKYMIYDILTVKPNETESLSQKTKSRREVTLITCTPDSKKRVIVKATEIKEI